MKYFALSTIGFYDDKIHKTLPADAIALTDEQYASLLEKPQGKKYGMVDGTVCFVDKVVTAEQVRSRRDAMIDDVSWRYERHAREERLGLAFTDSIEALDAYIQALCDITTQPGFPGSVVWPEI